MTNHAFASATLIAAALLTVACTDEATDPGALEFRSTWTCTGCGIGLNTPHVNGYDIPELNLQGQPNQDGVVLLGIASPTNEIHALEIAGEELAVHTAGGELKGSDLVGWALRVQTPGGATHSLPIYDHASLESWAGKENKPISVYAIAYFDTVVDEWRHICPESGVNLYDVAATLIFEETYDRDDITVDPDRDGWFTIACAGNAVYKMKMMSYAPDRVLEGHGPTTPGERQATLKMLTADYCGDGTAYTEPGTPVLWENSSRTIDLNPQQGEPEVEALWDAAGALCLTVPRQATIEEVACQLPTCDKLQNPTYAWATWTE